MLWEWAGADTTNPSELKTRKQYGRIFIWFPKSNRSINNPGANRVLEECLRRLELKVTILVDTKPGISWEKLVSAIVTKRNSSRPLTATTICRWPRTYWTENSMLTSQILPGALTFHIYGLTKAGCSWPLLSTCILAKPLDGLSANRWKYPWRKRLWRGLIFDVDLVKDFSIIRIVVVNMQPINIRISSNNMGWHAAWAEKATVGITQLLRASFIGWRLNALMKSAIWAEKKPGQMS